MSQPDWECIAQLGDAIPTEYGGYWIFRDKTGVYAPEGEYLFCPDSDDDDEDSDGPDAEDREGPYTAYRFSLEQCTFIDGVLSDNQFHPDHCAWWATTPERIKARPQDGRGLEHVASCMGSTADELVAMFISDDIVDRARAYRMIGEYHGFVNLDQYPLHLTRAEVEERYNDPKYQEV